jgi:hypothetical protein
VKMIRKALAISALALATSHASAALVLTSDSSSVQNALSVTDLLLGSGMGGLQVTVTTVAGVSSTAIWAPTTGLGGAASSSGLGGWSLSATGNTFAALWNFAFSGTAGPLRSIELSGIGANIAFDRSQPSPGTAGSAQGRDFTVDLDNDGFADDPDWVVTYSTAIGLLGAAPLGDIFGVLTIDFGSDGFSGQSFAFLQDTDTFVPAGEPIPEPGPLTLIATALTAAGLVRLQRNRKRG